MKKNIKNLGAFNLDFGLKGALTKQPQPGCLAGSFSTENEQEG
jgi:hypothetical protein